MSINESDQAGLLRQDVLAKTASATNTTRGEPIQSMADPAAAAAAPKEPQS